MTSVMTAIAHHELALLVRNPLMLFRFSIVYVVFAAALVADVMRMRNDRLSITAVGLMIIAAVGIATALAAESFVQEKERRTMEALLLIPTSAPSIARAKAAFVIGMALLGIALAFATGPIIVALLGQPIQYGHFFNRMTILVGGIVCPPAAIGVAAIGTVISSRSRSFQSATTTTPLLGMLVLIPVFAVAYLVGTSGPGLAIAVGAVWWGLAIGGWVLALSTMRPETMIRTRGR